MKLPTLLFFGAIDRFNYGDLLLATLMTKALKSEGLDGYAFRYAGMRRYDARAYNGLKVESIHAVERSGKLPAQSCIIVVGGDVLGIGNWSAAAQYLWPEYLRKIMGGVKRLLGTGLVERIIKRYYGGAWKYPFVIQPEYFLKTPRVIYNAVGGSGLFTASKETLGIVQNHLKRAACISVRDKETQDLINHNGRIAALSPDAAILMSDLYPSSELKDAVAGQVKQIINRGNYMCFQIRRSIVKDQAPVIAKQISLIQKRTKMNIVLLPLGRAMRHEDPWALKEIKSHLKIPCEMPDTKNVFELMALIAHANIFIGSSLHGTLTAMSFGIPYVCLNGIAKIKRFLSTWGDPRASFFADPDNLFDPTMNALALPPDLLQAQRKRLMAESAAGIRMIVETIKRRN